MANTASIFTTSNSQSVSFTSSSNYVVISGSFVRIGTDLPTSEANIQYTMRAAGVFSNLYVRCSSNAKAGATVVTFHKNLAAGNQTVTVPASTTGTFEDTTHTDSVSAGDEVTYEITFPAAAGAQMFNIISSKFLPSSNTAVSLLGYNSVTVNLTTATRYQGLEGFLDLINATEANAQVRIQTASTLRYLFMNLVANTSGTVTVRLRKNGVNGNSVITTGAAATGLFEDTTNTDTIAAGDDVCLSLVASTSTGTRAVIVTGITMLTTNNQFFLGAVDANNTEGIINFGTTNYIHAGGRPVRSTVENDTRLKARLRLVLSKLTVNITANSVNNTSTVRTRVNGANGLESVIIPSSTTGIFTDSTNSDSLLSTDEINYQIVTGGTTGNMTLRSIGVIADSTASLLYSYSPSDPSTTISDSISRLKTAIRTISDSAVSNSETLTKVRKRNRTVNPDSITVGADSLTRVKIANRTLPNTVSVSDSLAKLRKYFRSLNEAGISVNISTLLIKITRLISTEPASTVSDSISKKFMRFLTMSEPAITVSAGTIIRKVTRQKAEPATINVLDLIQKKASKNMSEPAKTVNDVLNRKVIRVMADPAITSSDTMTLNKKKAVRNIIDPTVNIGSSTIARKVSRLISDLVIVSDINDGHKRTTFSLTEPSITINDSLVRQKKAVRLLVEFTSPPIDVVRKKATKVIAEALISATDSRPVKKVTHFITGSVLTSDSITNRQKKAVRNILEPALNSASSISKSAKKFRTIIEPSIPNIADIINIAKRLVRNASESISVNDVISRQGFFKRVINEIPTAVSDVISKTKISGNEKHSYKVGQKFKIKKTDNTRLSYTDAKGEFSDKTEEY